VFTGEAAESVGEWISMGCGHKKKENCKKELKDQRGNLGSVAMIHDLHPLDSRGFLEKEQSESRRLAKT
jgi:hypothetical protein